MLTSVETALVHDVKVESWGSHGSRALVFGKDSDNTRDSLRADGAVYVVMQTPDDCDQVIRAAVLAKRELAANGDQS